MPFSSSLGKSQIAEWIKKNQESVKTILDIGAGSGTYSKLLAKNNLRTGITLVGIEAWEPYVKQYELESLYDKLIVTDARKLDWELLGKFDVVFAGDVLEHMTKEEAIKLVNQILDNSKTLIMSIPIVYMPQDEYEGNPFEVHVKPDWSHDEVMETWNNNIKDSFIGLKGNHPRIGVYWLEK